MESIAALLATQHKNIQDLITRSLSQWLAAASLSQSDWEALAPQIWHQVYLTVRHEVWIALQEYLAHQQDTYQEESLRAAIDEFVNDLVADYRHEITQKVAWLQRHS